MKKILVCAALALMACDPSAKASGDVIATGEPSLEYETCGATAQCESGLRCVDRVCRSTNAAIIGDYFAAAGDLAVESGDLQAAVNAYDKAVNQYKVAKKEPPVDLICRHGATLTAARNNPENAERAARALHQCARAAPVGSAMRDRALGNLAALGELGLDPDLLATDDAAKYLTKAPKGPDSESVKLTLVSTVSSRSGSYDSFTAAFGGQAMRDKLISCWESYNQASGKDELALTFRFKHRFQQGTYESQDGYKLSMYDGPAGDAAALACVKPVLEAAVDSFSGGSGSWEGDVTFKLAP